MNERTKALHEAADYAAFYADERMRLVGDTIMLDPILSGQIVTPRNLRRSRDLQIDGTINSAAYHAAINIADHLRRLADASSAEQTDAAKPGMQNK